MGKRKELRAQQALETQAKIDAENEARRVALQAEKAKNVWRAQQWREISRADVQTKLRESLHMLRMVSQPFVEVNSPHNSDSHANAAKMISACAYIEQAGEITLKTQTDDDVQAARLFKFYMETLPQYASWLGAETSTRGLGAFYWGTFDSKQSDLMNAFKACTDFSQSESVKPKLESAESAPANGDQFATLPSVSVEVDAAIRELAKIWRAANERKATLAVDDKYFLEQLVADYLPECLHIFEPFRLLNEDLRSRAEGLVLEQVQLLTVRTRDILSRVAEASFSQLEAHKIFLEVKAGVREGYSLG